MNQASTLGNTYLNLQNQQQLRLAFSLPLVDWGRRRAAVKTAELAATRPARAVAQEERSFEQTVLTQAAQLPAGCASSWPAPPAPTRWPSAATTSPAPLTCWAGSA